LVLPEATIVSEFLLHRQSPSEALAPTTGFGGVRLG